MSYFLSCLNKRGSYWTYSNLSSLSNTEEITFFTLASLSIIHEEMYFSNTNSSWTRPTTEPQSDVCGALRAYFDDSCPTFRRFDSKSALDRGYRQLKMKTRAYRGRIKASSLEASEKTRRVSHGFLNRIFLKIGLPTSTSTSYARWIAGAVAWMDNNQTESSSLESASTIFTRLRLIEGKSKQDLGS